MTNIGPTQTMEPPGHKPLVVNMVIVGWFEEHTHTRDRKPLREEEEGIGIASNEIEVKGADPATPGSLRRTGRGGTLAMHFMGTCSLARL